MSATCWPSDAATAAALASAVARCVVGANYREPEHALAANSDIRVV
jgi:hypothetical protein